MALTDDGLPALFHAAEDTSREGQQRYLWATRLFLISGLLAAVSALFTDGQVAGVCAAVFFAVGAMAAVWTYIEKPERLWYEGRAVAESVKTLAWHYAVGGRRFPREAVGVDEAFTGALGDVLETVDLTVRPRAGPQITAEMRCLRAADLETRKATYADKRIENQRAWYERKASSNRRSSGRWRALMIMLQLAGIVVGVLVFADADLAVGLLGLLATAAAAAAAWHQTRDHATLSEAYSVAAHELSLVKERVSAPSLETDWADFVEGAEQAISREHTLWRARRSRPIALMLKKPS